VSGVGSEVDEAGAPLGLGVSSTRAEVERNVRLIKWMLAATVALDLVTLVRLYLLP